MSLLDLYADNASDRGAAPAISYQRGQHAGTVLTWQGLLDRGSALADQLREAGAGPGTRIALEVADHPDCIPALLAVWGCGSVAVLIDPWWGSSIRSAVLAHSGVTHLLRLEPTVMVSPVLPAEGLASAQRPELPPGIALLAYTSGSTGAPKAVAIHHDRVMSSLLSAAAVIEAYRGRPAARFGSSLRLSGYGVLVAHFLWSAVSATEVVVLPLLNIETAGRYWSSLAEHAIDQTILVPPLFELLVRTSMIAAGQQPPLFINTSGPLTEAAHARFQDRFGARLLNCYGLTESTFAITVGDTDPAERPTRSIGRPHNMRIRLRDPHGTVVVGPGVGELEVYGPAVSAGYYDNPAANECLWSGRWLRSGDLGRRDEQGRYWIVGRLKDAVMKGGHTVYLTEVEEACLAEPGVLEAVAVRLEIGAGAEDIGVLVRAEPGETLDLAELQSTLESRLGRERAPRRALAVAEPLPRIGQDKLDRRAAQEIWDRLSYRGEDFHSGIG